MPSGRGRGASEHGTSAGWAIKQKLKVYRSRGTDLLPAQEEMARFLR